MVCEQIKALYPELKVDWVGTGSNGRKAEDNKRIIKEFCPPKDKHTGERLPTIDVLVHVGIAGEGLDSVNVSEIVHLNKASINNSNNQENGRAARYLDGVTGHINFDSCSEYAVKGYVGPAIMDAMDCLPPKIEEHESQEIDSGEYDPMPDEPTIRIYDMSLEEIDSGSPEIERIARGLTNQIVGGGMVVDDFIKQLGNPDSELHRNAVIHYRAMRKQEAEEFEEKSVVMQWKDHVQSAVSKVTGLVISIIIGRGQRFDKSLPGDIKRRINTRKKIVVGEIQNDAKLLKTHYQWIKNLETEIKETNGLPRWLQ
jgi:hypothetical protein